MRASALFTPPCHFEELGGATTKLISSPARSMVLLYAMQFLENFLSQTPPPEFGAKCARHLGHRRQHIGLSPSEHTSNRKAFGTMG